ncbi:hypothetical protein IV500_12400 [Paeniglutamicibacter antarcticus]|uniref:Uncharacterized protein n=1 Tax=Arthrobacter terrae TaxID=2935737 RepID=A0A931CQB8_9MICC|nr:hypothetical protein [Arthrobacter terrae]MBG0740181.1 hypothetical protein [Arthrobacter terrae]
MRTLGASPKRAAFQTAQGDLEHASLPWIEQTLAASKRVGAVREDLPTTLLIAVLLGMGEAMDLWLMSQPPNDGTLPELISALLSLIRGAVSA